MTVEEAIKILSDTCDAHAFTVDPDFFTVVEMGKDALVLLRLQEAAQV